MKPKANELERLLDRARRARPADDESNEHVMAPPGFATRVVARAWSAAAANDGLSFLQLLMGQGRRALLASAALAVASVAFNLPAVADAIEYDVLSADDPVTMVLDLS